MEFRRHFAKIGNQLWGTCSCGQSRLLQSLATGATLWPESLAFGLPRADRDTSLKALLVVAHPDDESECAAVVYRVTHEMGGIVDQIVVTNGEAGDQYSAPGRIYYRISSGDDAWRKRLVRIRRWETMAAGRVLGIRNHYFLEQRDTGFTLDPTEGLRAWDTGWIQEQLFRLIRRERYELVIVLLPAAGTHGHHQTIALLALDTIAMVDFEERPAAIGVQTAKDESSYSAYFDELPGYPLTRTFDVRPLAFDRRTPLVCHSNLDYSIVVNWAAAEHKSQGAFQMELGRRTHEHYWLFRAAGAAGSTRWQRFAERLQPLPSSRAQLAAAGA